jgi:hypothetical protein
VIPSILKTTIAQPAQIEREWLWLRWPYLDGAVAALPRNLSLR